MNKYQKRKSREIKKIMRNHKDICITYREAKKIWRFLKLFQAFSPCEDCDNSLCRNPKTVIAYCPDRR